MKNSPEESDFRELENRMRNFSETPDEAAWKAIQAGLTPVHSPWRTRIIIAAALALLLSGSFWLISSVNNTPSQNSTATSGSASGPAQNPEADSTKGITAPGQFAETAGGITASPEHASGPTGKSVANHSNAPSRTATSKNYPGSNRTDAPENSTIVVMNDPQVATTQGESNKSTDSDALKSMVILPGIAKDEKPPKDSTRNNGSVRPDSAATVNDRTVVKKKTKRSLTFYGLLTPSLSFISASPRSNDKVIVQDFKNPGIFSANRFGFSFEGGLQGQISSRLIYVAGLNVYHQSQTLVYSGVRTDQSVIQASGDGYQVNPVTFQQSINYTMLNAGIQSGLLYTLKEHFFTHRIGIMLQYQKGFYKSSDASHYNNAGSQYLNYQVVYRVEFAMSPRVNFMIQPSVSSSLLSNESLHAPLSFKQYRAGIGAGIIYHADFGKSASSFRLRKVR